MSNVQDAIERAAARFAHEIVSILRGATLSDIVALTGKATAPVSTGTNGAQRGGSRSRRTAEREIVAETAPQKPRSAGRRGDGRKRSRDEVTRLADRVVAFLGTAKGQVGVATIAEALKVPTAELGLPLSKLRRGNKVTTQGQKRSTVYRLA